MTEHKERTEFALEAKTMPLDVVMECLSLREQRVSTDLVRDEVEEELHKVTGIEGGGGPDIHKQSCGAYDELCADL